jgi:hypothetical protein
MNWQLTFTKEYLTSTGEFAVYNDDNVNVALGNTKVYDWLSVTMNPYLLLKFKGGHSAHVGTNEWKMSTIPSNLSLGYWFRNEKFSIGSDTSVDLREHSLNYVRLLAVINLTDLKIVEECSLVNSTKSSYEKNFNLGTILDYNDKLKVFGNCYAELSQRNVDLAVGFQYSLDDSTVLKGKVDNKYAIVLSLMKSYRKFIDFGFIVRVSTLSKKTKEFKPKYNFGLSLNIADI